MKKLLKSQVVKIVLLFLIWRICLFSISFISPEILPSFGARFPYYQERLINSHLPHFIWSNGNFDGVHYLGIAKDAYAYQFTQAFFPFYPMLIRLFSYLTFTNLIIAALLVSNLSFLLGLIIFYKLVTDQFDEKIATWSILFLLTFPTSYYFGAVYTEGLFFMLTVTSFYLFSKKRILMASIVGSFASATRLVGLFLVPALVFGKRKPFLILFIIPFGFLAYVLYLQLKFNNPLYFLSAQQIFGQERSSEIVLLPQVFYRYFKILLTTKGTLFANAMFELISTVFALAILILSIKKINKNWLVYSFLAVLTPTLTGTFTSMPRYILVVFPIYIYLAQIKDIKIKLAVLTVFLLMLIVATIVFSQGYWVA